MAGRLTVLLRAVANGLRRRGNGAVRHESGSGHVHPFNGALESRTLSLRMGEFSGTLRGVQVGLAVGLASADGLGIRDGPSRWNPRDVEGHRRLHLARQARQMRRDDARPQDGSHIVRRRFLKEDDVDLLRVGRVVRPTAERVG